VKVLLEYGADATRLDNFSQSCLQLSARYGHESLGKLMLGLNPRINAGDMFGMTALHRACASGALSLIPLLLKNHADWTRRDQFLDTPLDKAVVRGQTAAVEYFLKWLRRK
ncbi:ankyrin repeat protein, partial [Melanomma pulvis-pyrius CBS 109.77]